MCPKRKKQTRIKCKFLIIKHSEAPKCLTQAQWGASPGRCGMPRPDDAKRGRKGAWTYAGNVINTQKLKSAAKHTHTHTHVGIHPRTHTHTHTTWAHAVRQTASLRSRKSVVAMCWHVLCKGVCQCVCMCLHACVSVFACAWLCLCLHTRNRNNFLFCVFVIKNQLQDIFTIFPERNYKQCVQHKQQFSQTTQ